MTAITDLPALFRRIDRVFERVTGHPSQEMFNPPAPEDAIVRAETLFGVRLPEDVRQAYLWHDGGNFKKWRMTPSLPHLIPPYYRWIPLEESVKIWTWDRDFDKRMLEEKNRYWNPPDEVDELKGMPVRLRTSDVKWIPVGNPNADVFAYVDLHPSQWGTSGQLFKKSTVADGHQFIASSFTVCLSRMIDALDDGRYFFDEDEGDWISARTGESVMSLNDL